MRWKTNGHGSPCHVGKHGKTANERRAEAQMAIKVHHSFSGNSSQLFGRWLTTPMHLRRGLRLFPQGMYFWSELPRQQCSHRQVRTPHQRQLPPRAKVRNGEKRQNIKSIAQVMERGRLLIL